MCINKLGECPRGMTPFLTTIGTKVTKNFINILIQKIFKQCSLNVAGSCPDGSSCVRSNLNEPICCTSTAQCPANQKPYLIPGNIIKLFKYI